MSRLREAMSFRVFCRRPLDLAVFLLLACGADTALAGQDETSEGGRKRATAVRVEGGSIRLDGRLDEEAWRRAEPVTDFVQREPVEGVPASQATEVRIAFDDSALYVGARMRSTDPAAIQAPMGRRDNVDQAEFLQLSLDTYLDRRTAYTFGVTASGVRFDHYHPTDSDGNRDATFDPVWQARTAVDAEGWTAELWVPFSQLRFNESDRLVWGLNLRRFIPTLNEEDDWVLVRRTEEGWASRFGDLHGLDGVRPPQRLEIVPYVAASSTMVGGVAPSNPFDGGLNGSGRVGADVKMSVGSSLTLDVTVNPDFGQVEADPAEVNLSVNETFFQERRPFFLEGSRILNGASNNYFYSRRIGATPRGPAEGDYVDYPSATTILGAAKLTGRLASGTSVGVLGAVTGAESARTFALDTNAISRIAVAPRTSYGVGRVEQEIGSQGSTVGVHVAGMHRDLNAGDPLASLLVRNSIAGGADAFVRLADSTYEGRVVVGFSHVNGEAAAIERVQRTSVHYYQRPDRGDGVLLDPTLTSLTGMQLRSNFDRIAGRHWLWGVTLNADSPAFETNDAGRVSGAGEIDLAGRLFYRETQPGAIFRAYNIGVETQRSTDFDGALGARYFVNSINEFTFRNFWVATLNVDMESRGLDPRLTRGGPAMGVPRLREVRAYLASNEAATTRWAVNAEHTSSENGDRIDEFSASFSVRPRPTWQVSFDPTFIRERATRQFVASRAGGRPETYGVRYLFGTIDRSTASMQVRFNYTFKPDLNLDLYAEPFAASGHYSRFGELLAARSRLLRVYGEDGTAIAFDGGDYTVIDSGDRFGFANPDFNVRSFRSNVVLRWEWRPGSTFYAVWQQDREGIGALDDRAGFGSLWRSLSGNGDNILAVKASFWWSR